MTQPTCLSPNAMSRPPLAVRDAALRVLQRTAWSLATTPGGLRFVPGSRPWLRDLPGGRARTALSPVHFQERLA